MDREEIAFELRLPHGSIWSHRAPDDHQLLKIVDGEAYVTEEGRTEDWFLQSGDELPLLAHRLVVVQGHPEVTFLVREHIA